MTLRDALPLGIFGLAYLVLARGIVVEQARHRGVHVSWRDYLKVGVPVTALTLGLDLALLGLLE